MIQHADGIWRLIEYANYKILKDLEAKKTYDMVRQTYKKFFWKPVEGFDASKITSIEFNSSDYRGFQIAQKAGDELHGCAIQVTDRIVFRLHQDGMLHGLALAIFETGALEVAHCDQDKVLEEKFIKSYEVGEKLEEYTKGECVFPQSERTYFDKENFSDSDMLKLVDTAWQIEKYAKFSIRDDPGAKKTYDLLRKTYPKFMWKPQDYVKPEEVKMLRANNYDGEIQVSQMLKKEERHGCSFIFKDDYVGIEFYYCEMPKLVFYIEKGGELRIVPDHGDNEIISPEKVEERLSEYFS